jgi:hypothetical protein
LKYFQAKQAKVTKPAVAKIGVKRKKATA